MLAPSVYSLVVGSEGGTPDTYRKQDYDLPALPFTHEAVKEALNHIRRDARLQALELDRNTEAADDLAQAFRTRNGLRARSESYRKFMSRSHANRRIADVRFSVVDFAGKPSPGELLSVALEDPAGRHALLSGEADHLTVGFSSRGDELQAVFLTWSLFDRGKSDEYARRVFDRLSRLRKGGPPGRASGMREAAQKAASDVLKNAKTPAKAAAFLRERLRNSQKRLVSASKAVTPPTYGYAILAPNLTDFSFPRRLLEMERVHAIVSVSHHRPKRDRPGLYAILIAWTEY